MNGKRKDSKFHNTTPEGKTKNKKEGCRPEGNITDPRKKRMEETNRKEEETEKKGGNF
jgi:hypothetical protein